MSPRTSDHEALAARLTEVGEELRRVHLERMELMSEAARLARAATPDMAPSEISTRLGLPPAIVRSFGI